MIVEFVIFNFVLLFAFLLWRRYQQLQLRQRLGIPGPKTNLIFGNLHQIMGANKKYPDHAMMIGHEWLKQYGSYFGYYFGPKLIISIVDLDLAKDILIKQFDCFVDRFHFIISNKNTTGSVIHAEGDKWKQIRSAVSPIFTASKMKQMSSIIHDKIDTMIGKLAVLSGQEKTFDIYDVFQALTLDVIGQCAFGITVNCQTDSQDTFLIHCQQFFRNAGIDKSKLLQLAIFFPELGPLFNQFTKYSKFGPHESWLVDILKRVVQERKQSYKNYKNIDVFQLLFEQKDENEQKMSSGTPEDKKRIEITDDVLVGNGFVFLLAGYETTSTSLAYTAWLLAKHRDVQEKLQHEIDEKVLSKDTVNYDLVHKLPYLDAVFKESLRLCPPVIQFTTRTCVKECDVGPIHFLPGMEANFPVREYHWNPDFWQEPEKFDPERFLNNPSLSSYIGWMPFGIGPRNCIGMRFADMEFKMALVCILQKFNIVFGPESEDPLQTMENFIMLRPKNGVQLRVEKRSK